MDNVLRKVQVHYISFIIDISNCIINNIIGKEKGLSFKDIDYSFKKQINYTAFEELRNYKIKDILQKPVSKKFRTFLSGYNKEIYDKVINESEWIKDLFDLEYSWFFDIYYNECKPLGETIDIKGTTIYMPKEVKIFNDLLKKNDSGKEFLIYFIKEEYMRFFKKRDIIGFKNLFSIKNN